MKRALSLLLSIIMVLSSTVFAVPVMDTVESADEVVFVEETVTVESEEEKTEKEGTVKLQATTAIQPGLNIFTGTADDYTFNESAGENDISGFLTENVSIGDRSTGNQALWLNTSVNTTDPTASKYGYIAVKDFPVYTDADRPFEVVMDVYYMGQVRVMDNDAFDSSLIEAADAVVIYKNSKKWWNDVTATIRGTQTDSAHTSGGYYDEGYYGDVFKNLFVYGYNKTTIIDNLNITPYYKVTYDANGASGTAEADYFLTGPYTDLDNGSGLEKAGYSFKGWSLTKDGAVVTSVTPTPGSDITLYAVWEKISVKPGINVWTGTTAPYGFDEYDVEKLTNTDTRLKLASDTWIVTEEDLATDTDFANATLDATNKILKLNGNWNNFTVIKSGTPVIEKDRPITVSLKVINNSASNIRLYRNVISSTDDTVCLYRTNEPTTATTGWTEFKKTVVGNVNFAGTDAVLDGDANVMYKDGTQNVKSITIMLPYGRGNAVYPVYMDDISVVPHYKVTYNANGGNGTVEPEYFLADSFTPNDGSALSKDGYVFMGWATTANGKPIKTVTPTVGEDITLYAIWEEKATVKPGLNILTGTTAKLDFEKAACQTDEDYLASFTYTDNVAIGEYTVGESTTQALKLTEKYKYLAYTNFPFIEKERPMDISIDYIYNGQVRVLANAFDLANIETIKETKSFITKWHSSAISEWRTVSATGVNGGTVTDYKSNPGGNTYYAWQTADDITQLYFYSYSTQSTSKPLWLDNLSVVPYYKVTYDANGATGTAAADYFLDGPYTALDDGSTLTKTGYNLAGWSLTKDGAVVTSVTPTPGEDITLYAVWEKAITTGSKPGLNMLNQESNEPLDFESYQTGSVPSMFLAGGATLVGVMEQPHSDSVNSSGKVLAMKRTGNYPALHFNIPEADRFEADRPVYLEFKRHKHYVPAADESFKNSSAFWVQKNSVDYMAKDIGGFTTAGSDWIQDKHLIDFSQAWKFGTDEAYPNQLYNIILRGDSSQSNAGTLYICYDDMLYIPSYKLSYMVNDGTDAVSSYEYFLLPDDSTDNAPYKAGDTYTVNTADVAMPTRDGYAFMGWAKTPDATTPATEISFTLENEDIALYAVWEKRAELKPGLNIFTGTTSAYTFDGTESDISGFYTNNTEVVTKEVETGDGNKALQLKTAGKGAENAQGYFAVKNFPVYTDADRPFDVKMDVYYTGQVRIMDKAVFDAALKEKADTVVVYTGTGNRWLSDLGYTISGTMTTSQGTGGHYSSDYYGDVFENLIVYGYNSNTIVDNLSITPYYKVTYDANGGTGTVAPAYFLDELTLNDGSALSKDGYNFKGWSLTKDGAVVTSVTPTAGEDITLYAVWETAITTGSKPGLNMLNQATNGGLDFESYLTGSRPAVITSGTSNLPISVMENMVKDSVNGTDKVIAVQSKASTETYPALWFNIPAADRFEADRPVFLSFKRMQHYVPTEANETFTAAGNFWINKNSNSTTIVTPNGFIANSTEKWYQDTYYFTGEQLTAGNSDALSAIILRNKAEKANPGIVYVCYDDINVIPAYKLNYMTNDGTDAVSSYEYFLLPDDSTNNAPYKAGDTYTVNTADVAIPTRDGYAFMGWAKTPNATTAETEISFTLANEDIKLYAVWEKRAELKPGHNIFTGTENAYTFDGTESDISGFYTDKAEVVTNEKTTGDGNKALQFKTTTHEEADSQGYFAVKNFPVYTDADRPFEVKMDVYYTGQVRVMDTDTFDYSLITQADTVVIHGKTSNVWTNNLTYKVYGTMTDSVGASGHYDEGYYGDVFENLIVYGYNKTTTIDNLSITPYYKVTYDANGGTGTVAPVYFLNGGSLDDGSTLTRDGYVFIGWSMDKNATEYDAINTFTKYDENDSLLTGDVTLYAVWSQETTAKPGINLWTGTTEAATFEDGDVNLTRFEYTSNVSIKTETEKTGSDNNILSISKQNAQIDFKNFPVVEKERPIRIAFDYRYGGQVRLSVNAKNRYNGDDTDKTDEDGNVTYTGIHPDAIVIHSGKTNGAWYSLDTKIQGSVPGTFFKEPYANADIESLTLWAYSYNHLLAYDNIIMMPYYKVTYVDTLGAEVPETEWWIPTEDEPEFTVNDARLTKRGYNFLGWSYNGEVVTTFTPTVGEDIVLTAVWEEANADETLFKYEHTATGGIANGYVTVVTATADAAYTTATMYLANDSGILSGYTSFGAIALTDGMGTYTVSGNRAFPSEATAIYLVLSGDGLTDKTAATYTIPTANRLTAETPLFTFWATSDTHLGGYKNFLGSGYYEYWSEMGTNRNAAFDDIFSSDADFMFINGDVMNGGGEGYTDYLSDYLSGTLNKKGMPVFLTNGNHEFDDDASTFIKGDADLDVITGIYNGQVDYIAATYPDIKITKDGDNLWYAADIKGTKFIFMSTPERVPGTHDSTYTISDAQLSFIENQLYDGEKSNKTTFLITHVGLNGYIPAKGGGMESGLTKTTTKAIEALLAEHPNTIVISGHSHSDLSTDEVHFTTVGDMTTKFTHLNEGCLVWLNAFDGVGDSANSSAGAAGKWLGFSAGQYIEVYKDKVIVKARKFAGDGCEWFGHAMYVIETPGADVTLPDVSISGDAVLGSTLAALVDGNVPADNAGYTYEWIVDDKVVGTEKTYTVDSTVGGEYVRLRVYKDGAYASCNSAALMTTELKTIQAASIRTSTPQGMRYAGYVADVTKGKATVEEYGFIVAAEEYFTDGDYSELVFNEAGDKSANLGGTSYSYVAAAAYVNGGVDRSEKLTLTQALNNFSETALDGISEDGWYYSVVLTNIPESHYQDAIVGKSYVKIDGVYYYGDAVVRSIYEMAEEYKAKYEAAGKEVPEYITSILGETTTESN